MSWAMKMMTTSAMTSGSNWVAATFQSSWTIVSSAIASPSLKASAAEMAT
jgi:hypothetical protein